MTVAELIEKLKTLPADLPVYLGDWSEEYAPDHKLSEGDIQQMSAITYRPFTHRADMTFEYPNRIVLGSSRF